MRVAITGFGASWNRGAQVLTPRSSLRALFAATPAPVSPPDSGPHEMLRVNRAVREQLWETGLIARRRDAWRVDRGRVAVVYGSSKGDLEHLENSRIWADWSLEWAADWALWPHHFSVLLARALRVFGPVLAPCAACATGAHAIAIGAGLIESGRADVVIAGAIEPPQPAIILAAYRQMNALSRGGVMRPFDARRDGFIAGNGDGFLILEAETSARKRGAAIHGFLTGASLQCDASHMTSMSAGGETIARAIRNALGRAGNPPVGYLSAHGTATRNDSVEARAIAEVFGSGVPVGATKALTGHLLGASGAVEAVICLLAMREGFAPPILNLENRDKGIDLDLVTGTGRNAQIDAALCLNYGFGGHIGALIFEKN